MLYDTHPLVILCNRLYNCRTYQEICPMGQGGCPKESSSPHYKRAARAPKKDDLKKRPPPLPVLLPRLNKAAIRPHRLANEPRRALQSPKRRSLRLALRRNRRPETHLLLHLWPSRLRSLRARSSPGGTASTSPNRRPRHQVMLHRRPLDLRVPAETLVPPLNPHLHLPLRLRALTVLEDGRGRCMGSHRGSLKRV